MIKKLRLQNFRSYSDKSFSFSAHINIIVGPNTIGKTNILEAILVSRIGSSYRAKELELIKFKKNWARLDANDDSTSRVVKLRRDQKPYKTIDINGKTYNRLPGSLKLPIVLFEPNHLQLLSGSPERRRNYLDSFLEQLSTDYGLTLRRFNRALLQRNTLLKARTNTSSTQLFPWNIRLSQLAGQIIKARSDLVNHLSQILPDIYKGLSKSEVETGISYLTQLTIPDYETNYLKKLEATISEDMAAGFTLVGPHRDDFSLTFNGHPATNYASRGELRTAVMALKVAELESLKKRTESPPIILLDDVFSELDNTRRKALTNYLKDSQTFITTTDADVVAGPLKSTAKVINLS